MKKILPAMGRKPTQAASGQTKSIVTIRSSLRYCACTAVALLTGLSGRSTALGQQDNNIDIWRAAPSDLTLAITQAPPVLTVSQVPTADSALTSTEQGHTMLEESFDYREWRLEARRKALEDTKFEFNLRSFYFDRSDFNRSE